MEMEFPNSPGVAVWVSRGGVDPLTGEVLSDQMVNFEWEEALPDGTVYTARRSFLGPS